jgi:hypothetical protein
MSEQLDLTTEEKEALIALLKRTLEYARFPLAPRLDPLKAILTKLDPPPPQPAPLPPRAASDPSISSCRPYRVPVTPLGQWPRSPTQSLLPR